MSHKCEECGESFGTLTRLRLHDCSPSERNDTEKTDSPDERQLAELVSGIGDGEFERLPRAMATYETVLRSAHEAGDNETYQDITGTYRKPLINGLDEATQARGWELLNGIVDEYHPRRSDGFPYVTTIIENVVGRYLIRTRHAESVDVVPVAALDYMESILTTVGDEQDFVREGVHPYGWGIGHPDHAVADRLYTHASDDIFLVNPMLEHAFYADQYAAVDVLERIIHDETIQHTLPYSTATEITEARYLLDAPAGAASDEFWPTIPRYWDWHKELNYTFELSDDVEQRIRDLVIEEGLTDDLPENWDVTDLTL